MSEKLKTFFSNRLEILYEYLKLHLFPSNAPPFQRPLVVVYGPAMKNWLMLRMAQDPALNIAMGIEFIYLNQAFEFLVQNNFTSYSPHLPSFLELSFGIENELLEIIRTFSTLSEQEQFDWIPIIRYLKFDSLSLNRNELSRKVKKRIIGLSQELARLFLDYTRYGYQMVQQWETSSPADWQSHLWLRLFNEKTGWSYLSKKLQQKEDIRFNSPVHFFSISFITGLEFDFLHRLADKTSVFYYMLSPCAVFWSDIRSDRESASLRMHWAKRLGEFSPTVLSLDEFLRDRNPLLANFGRVGREMVCQIENSDALTTAYYLLPKQSYHFYDEFAFHEDCYFEENESEFSLLNAIQADLLLMRQLQGQPKFNFETEKKSIQLHAAPNIGREVQMLYHHLLEIISKNNRIYPSDIIVMTPQIDDYAPYIQAVFGSTDSLLDYQILDTGMQSHSDLIQGFLQLFQLSEGRWSSSQILQLFEHASFQNSHQLTQADYIIIQRWVEQAGILWGEDWLHRNDILLRRYCEKEMVDETGIGTWDYGLNKLLIGLMTVHNDLDEDSSPCTSIDFSQAELLGKWIKLLNSLRDDLSSLHDESQMSLEDWANYLTCLLQTYFKPDEKNLSSISDYENLKAQFEVLRTSSYFIKDAFFSFESIKTRLLSLLKNKGASFREDHLQSVRFCSLAPLRSIPSKIIALLGMHEGAFPRSIDSSSLNRMIKNPEVSYTPLSTDYDRYLFLESIQSAQEYFLISYQGYNQTDSKKRRPSLVVEELFSYLDKHYTIKEEAISKTCIFFHPFDAFNQDYFKKHSPLSNFSNEEFNGAKAHYQLAKTPPHYFLKDFIQPYLIESSSLIANASIDVKYLTSAAINPIKFHLQKALNMYFQSREDRELKTEEQLTLSVLDKYRLKKFALKESTTKVVNRAESEGKLPFGLFKTVAIRRLKDDISQIHGHLEKHGLKPTDLIQVEFCPSYLTPVQIGPTKWMFPPLFLKYPGGHQLPITGKIMHATHLGLVSMSKGTLDEAWKSWPQFLLHCHAAQLRPDFFGSHLILTESARPFPSFFNDPEPYMKQFISYYRLCLQEFSPILPEWAPLIIREEVDELQEKINQLYTESFSSRKNRELQWLFNKDCLPCSKAIIQDWKEETNKLLGDLIQSWFPLKDKKVNNEAV